MIVVDKCGIHVTEADACVCESGNRAYWDSAFHGIVREYLGEFCPYVEYRLNGVNADGVERFSAGFSINDKSGDELVSRSKSIEDGKERIPEEELEKLQSCIEAFHRAGEAKDVPKVTKEFIRNFRLPDPRRLKWAWRIARHGKRKRLIVLWGLYDRLGGLNGSTFLSAEATSPEADGDIKLGAIARDFIEPPTPPWRKCLRSFLWLALLALPVLGAAWILVDRYGRGIGQEEPTEPVPTEPVPTEHAPRNEKGNVPVPQPPPKEDFVQISPSFAIVCKKERPNVDGSKSAEFAIEASLPGGEKRRLSIDGVRWTKDNVTALINVPSDGKAIDDPAFRYVLEYVGSDKHEIQAFVNWRDNGNPKNTPMSTLTASIVWPPEASVPVKPVPETGGGRVPPSALVSPEMTMPERVRFVIRKESETYNDPRYSVALHDDSAGLKDRVWPPMKVVWRDIEILPDGSSVTNSHVKNNPDLSYEAKYTFDKIVRMHHEHLIRAVVFYSDSSDGSGSTNVFVTGTVLWPDSNGRLEELEPPVKEQRSEPPRAERRSEPQHGGSGAPGQTVPKSCPVHGEKFIDVGGDQVCPCRCRECGNHLGIYGRCPYSCAKHPGVCRKSGSCPECDGPPVEIEQGRYWIDSVVSGTNVILVLKDSNGTLERDVRTGRIQVEWKDSIPSGASVNGNRNGLRWDVASIIASYPDRRLAAGSIHTTTAKVVDATDGISYKAAKYAWSIKKTTPEERRRSVEHYERHITKCGEGRDQDGAEYFIFRLSSYPADFNVSVKRWEVTLSRAGDDGRISQISLSPKAIPGSNSIRLYKRDIPGNGNISITAHVDVGLADGTLIPRKGNFVYTAGVITASKSFDRELVHKAEALARELQAAVPQVRTKDGTGTAFAISGNRLLTNHHVVSGSEDNVKVRVTTSAGKSRDVPVRVVKADEKLDLALLEVTDGFRFGKFLEFAQGAEPTVGDDVIALGYPYDGENEYKHSEGSVTTVIPKYVVHNARVWPGNSGGPLVSIASGKVIGVTVKFAYDELARREIDATASLAIPIPATRRFLEGR